MTTTFLEYPLSDVFVHNWLVAGPLALPAPEPTAPLREASQSLELIQRLSEPASGVTEPVIDLGPLTAADPKPAWRYYRCRADHFVDFTTRHPAQTYLRAWAYAQLRVPVEQSAQFKLTTHGPADIWLNGSHLARQEHLDRQAPRTTGHPVTLQAGSNEILIRFENAGVRDIPYALALKIEGLPEAGVAVLLPTNIEPGLLEKRLGLEALVEGAIIDRYVYGYLSGDRYDRNEPLTMRFAEDLRVEGTLTWRLQSLNADIFQEGTQLLGPNATVEMAKKFPLRNGPHHLALSPNMSDVYEKQLRFDRKELFFVARSAFGQVPDPQPVERRQEALEDAAKRRNDSVYVELAKMALGQWEKVDRKIIDQTITAIQQRGDGSVADLLGLLGSALRYKKKQPIIRDIRAALQAAAQNFLYSPDDTADAAERERIDFEAESRQILFHASEILAGQLFSGDVFGPTGNDGDWHQARGEELASAWMRQRGRYGFKDWNSPAGTEAVLAALSHLADLASNDTVRELASVLMDKIFFSLAVESFRGAYGSTSGASDTGSVLSPRLQPTSGIHRLLWGTGNFNEHLLGSVSLATCKQYELPSVIYRIAADPEKAAWSRTRQVTPAADSAAEWASEAVTASFKTQDYLLSCVQDYHPGQRGRSEHIWQATLGPDAVVFVNHPTSMSEDDSHRPNLWAGNGVLPRAAQWGDVLIAAYQLPEDDWLGFTHAYFPAKAFDEYVVDPKWAFARKGRGYLALTAARGLDFIWTGQTAGRELRSAGRENVWVCQMGQQPLDGTFDEFQRKVRALDLAVDGLSTRLRSLRGETIEFGWQGPLLINGAAQPLASSRHIENPYCTADLPATQLEVVYKGGGIRLKFE